jgi:DNA primase catalytic subunit
MRYSTLRERVHFYETEFDLTRVEKWFERPPSHPTFAAIIGRHTHIYPAKYRDDASTTILIEKYRDVEEVRRLLVEFQPEAVYYDRNLYDDVGKKIGQELAFDLDPENIPCPIHGTLDEKMERQQGLSFCKAEFQKAKAETIRLYEALRQRFTSMRIVYSGRGLHIHVFDRESFQMSYDERKKFALNLKDEGFPIDEWVTSGGMRLIRLPYSLHGMVSRIVIPLAVNEVEGFDPITDRRCRPQFLKP